jgi:predicted Zn-dependent peptidase
MVIAGNVNHSKTVDLIETFVSGWKPNACDKPKPVPAERGNHWVKQKSSQVHLSFAFDAPNAKEDSSILESVAMTVFGGSSSGRLFTQVRQRRSLCYSVSAHYAASKEHSVVRMHAGTTPQRAQETADICLEQLHRLKSGITKEEFDRTIHTMKARTVMRGESTAARAGALWGDLYALEKTRSLDDRLKEINNVTFEEVNEWLARRTFGKLTFVAVGPEHITADRI